MSKCPSELVLVELLKETATRCRISSFPSLVIGAPGIPGGSAGKESAAVRDTWVPSLRWEDPLEKGKATHSSILPGEFHGLYSPWDHKELDMTDRPSLSLSISNLGLPWWLSSKEFACNEGELD